MYSEELHNLYSSADITRIIKLRWMACAVHITYMGKKVLVRIPDGKRLEELGVGESVTLELSKTKGMGRCGLDSFGSEWDWWLL
jgi:hypothetical protein